MLKSNVLIWIRFLSIVVFLLFFSNTAKPQSGSASKKEAGIIKDSKLIVILDDKESDYNSSIK